MKLAQGLVVAGRYELVECLGTGAMGEVWRAQDTRFESRLVAVKFLREDETLKEDALNRERMVIRLEQQVARGGINLQFALEAIASALAAGNMEGLRAKTEAKIGGQTTVQPSDVTAIFDELVNDPAFNENARMRAKLRRLFRDEANTVANLRHDNVVSIFDYGDHEGNPYLVMDYIEGRTLYQVIQGQELLGRPRRLQLIEDLCAGLGYAHRHKLVHRDIKPANLIIDSSTGSLKILDFGVVRRLGSASTVGVPVGTFCYMSPEQTKGAATLDHRSDIFAVGLVFYELMSGRKAFPPGKSIGDLVARIQRDPPPSITEQVPSLPKGLEEIINKAVEKKPEDRYQELTVMAREIGRIRSRLEAAEQSERTMIVNVPDPTVLKVKPTQASVTDLLQSAEQAFETGDDHAAIEFCNRVLTVKPGFPAALSLLARAETRQREARLRDVLVQTEKLMAIQELTSARAMLGRARDIDPSSPRIRAVEEKLQAALIARDTAERVQQAPVEPPRPPAPEPFNPPPAPPVASAGSDDADTTTAAATRQIAREPLVRPPVPKEPPQAPPQVQRPVVPDVPAAARPSAFVPPAPPAADAAPPRPRPPSTVTEPEVPVPGASQQHPAAPPPAPPPSPQQAETMLLQQIPRPGRGGAPPSDPIPPVPPEVIGQRPPSGARKPKRSQPHVDPAPPVAVTPQAESRPMPPSIPVPPAPAAPPVQPARPQGSPPPGVPVGQARRSNWLGLAVAGGLVAVLVISMVVLFMRSGDSSAIPGVSSAPTQAPTQPPQTPAETTPGAAPANQGTPPAADPAPQPPAEVTTTEPAAAGALMTTVVIDIRPWARVKIVPVALNPDIPVDPFYAPFSIDLPAGEYNLECENGGVTRATTFQLNVVPGAPQYFTRNMPGFNATKIVDGLLGQD